MTNRSFWQESSSPASRVTVPFTDTGLDTEVAVVGGGLAGLCTAVMLAEAGRQVTVLEARDIAKGTTARSTAKVTLLQGTRLSHIASLHRASAVADYVEANRAGQSWLHAFCREHGVDVQHRDAVTYATSSSGRDSLQRELEVARQNGLPVEWDGELPLPFATSGAVRLRDQLQVDPSELLRALSTAATAAGVHVVTGARVLRSGWGNPAELSTTRGRVRASTVVLATGSPILDRGGFFARLEPARSYTVTFATDAPLVDAMYLSADSPSRSLRDAVTADGEPILLVGGAGHVTGRRTPTSGQLDALRSWTHQQFGPLSGALRETHAWSAQDYLPADELPMAGPLLPGSEGVLVATGFAKWGFTNAVAAALALTGRLVDDRPSWSHTFDPWTTGRLAGLPQASWTNLTVGAQMARGWASVPRTGLPPTVTSEVDGCRRRVSGVCPHLGGVVRWSDAEQSWDCPLHGSRFDADGSVLDGPATRPLRSRD